MLLKIAVKSIKKSMCSNLPDPPDLPDLQDPLDLRILPKIWELLIFHNFCKKHGIKRSLDHENISLSFIQFYILLLTLEKESS